MNKYNKPSKREMENKQIVVRYLIGTVVEYVLRISAIIFITFKVLEFIGYILEWIFAHTPAWMVPVGMIGVIIMAIGVLIIDGNLEIET